MAASPNLEFEWAKKRWSDPVSGTEVVCISPEMQLHFRNTYFRVNMFTRDGAKMALMSQDPDEEEPSAIWCIDLQTGEAERLLDYGHESLSGWAVSPQSRLMHVLDSESPEVIRVDLDTGKQRRIRPSEPLPAIYCAEPSADDRYIYTYWCYREIPEGMSNHERIAMMGSEPGRNVMYRIDLDDGQAEPVFETDEWWMGHSNPNPVYPHLYMCCQEGFIWTDRYPKPENFQRIRIHDFREPRWLDLREKMKSWGAHEHWSANGLRVYSHSGAFGGHAIFKTDLETEQSTRYLGPPGCGYSIHVAPAADESFVIGDGFNFCKADLGTIEGLGEPGDGDNPWSWDGLRHESPGETIWKYELPEESLWPTDRDFDSTEELQAAIAAHPGQLVKTTPLCRFRSLSKMKLNGMRLESNAHVTPDSRWGVFQSASEDGLFEVWAARVKE